MISTKFISRLLVFLSLFVCLSWQESVNKSTTVFPEAVNNMTTPITSTQRAKNNNPLDFKRYPGLVFVFVASMCGSIWLFFITFFNSRLLGLIVTKLINKFYMDEDSYFGLGAFSFSLLSGKIMFRDLKYITKDYSIRVVDGFAIFSWWLKYIPDDSEEYHGILRHSEENDSSLNRLTIQLNGFECHLYNRSSVYDRLQEIFKNERFGDARKTLSDADLEGTANLSKNSSIKEKEKYQWSDLIPTIKFNINSGKVALGNKLVETTFWIHYNSASGIYSTTPAASSLDEYTHVVKCRCEDVRVMLSTSPGYTGKKTEPPRFMGEGFVVLQSGEVEFNYFQDVPGVVPEDLARAPDSDPLWSLNAVFTKATTITYGPWADKQREKLQKLFLPNDYQEQQPTRPLQPGELRSHTGFDLRVKFQDAVTMDILFSKDDETTAIHVCAASPCSIHFYLPWTVNEFGYTSTLIMQLHKLEIATSLEFRKVLECESMEAEIIMTVPRIWNQFQRWSCEFLFNETTLYFIYQHTNFIQDLLNDWAVTEPADIAFFVPYEWEFRFHFKDYELVCLVNEHNWIDCTNDNENSQLAFCGEALEVTFLLPFAQFLPQVEKLRFFCRAESLVLRMFLPESNTLRRSVLSLVRNNDQNRNPAISRINSMISDTDEAMADSDRKNCEDPSQRGWRRKTGSGWVDVCSTPVLVLNIFYKYHPVHVSNEYIDGINRNLGVDHATKEPASLEPDLITVELEAGPFSIKLLGSLFRQFVLGFKENYFGVAQNPTEFNAVKNSSRHAKNEAKKEIADDRDARHFRPMHANITVVLLDVKAELIKHSFDEPVSPMLNMERLTFEMNKTYRETRLQLITSPATIVVKDSLSRQSEHAHLSRGFLSLSGLQFRGHAFFSDNGVPLGSDTIEYAWLTEIQCGSFTGKLTLPQLQSIILWAEVFRLHLLDEENTLSPPNPDLRCQHGTPQKECQHFEAPSSKHGNEQDAVPMLCPTEDEVKYKMTRVSVESVNLFIVEAECACNVKAAPVRMSSCTSHTSNISKGCSFFLNDLTIKQYVQDLSPPEEVDLLNGNSRHQSIYMHSLKWIEIAVAAFGPITADSTTFSNDVTLFNEQQDFLRRHDKLLKRLWFLWSPLKLKSKIAADRAKSSICGCVGGCRFFGNNSNGVKFFTTQVLDAGEKRFGRFGSESIWGGANERQGITERLKQSSTITSSLSIGEASVHAKKMSLRNQQAKSVGTLGRIRSNKDSDSIGLWSSCNMSGSLKYSETYRDSMASRLPQDRSRSDIAGSINPTSRRRSESEGTFYSCESMVEIDGTDADDDSVDAVECKAKFQDSNVSIMSSMESFISAVSSKGDLVSFDMVDAPQNGYKPLMMPALASLYGDHLRRVNCSNWKNRIPEELHRRYSLINGIKSIRTTSAAAMPNFQYEGKGRLPFVIASRSRFQTSAGSIDSEDEADDAVFIDPHQCDDGTRDNLEGPATNRTVANIKVHKSVDIIVTPIILQACERYIQSLRSQEKIQHPAYIMDSLHLSCIKSSEEKHNENRAFHILEEEQDTNSHKPMKHLLNNYFPATNSITSVIIPKVNFVSFQVSAEPFNASEQSSLSGQIGSNFSANFESPKRTCTLALAASMSNLQLCHVAQNQHQALQHLTLSLLQRRSVFKSKNDYLLLKKLHDVLDDNNDGFKASIRNIDVQLQRMDCEMQDYVYDGCVTAVPNAKTMVPFSLHKGDDVDVDDLTWLEQTNSQPVGKIIMECGMKCLSLDVFNGKKLCKASDLGHKESKSSPRMRDTLSGSSVQGKFPMSRTASKRSSNSAATDKEASRKKQATCAKSSLEQIELNQLAAVETDAFSQLFEETNLGEVVLEINEDDDDHCDVDDGDKQTLQQKLNAANASSVDASKADASVTDAHDAGSVNVTDVIVKEPQSDEFAFKTTKQGQLHVNGVWFNLAHPTRLKVLQEGNDHCVNLVTSIVPSVCCWIPVYVDLLRAFEAVTTNYKKHRYSLLACTMAQALPDKGKLLVKHNINSMCTTLSTYLQEEHSSQLIYVLRRQMTGSRLQDILSSLEDKANIPRIEVLEKGIHALARQWNAVIIGSTHKDLLIKPDSRKLVVGRGVLTRKDRAILMRGQSSYISEMTETAVSADQKACGNRVEEAPVISEDTKRESKSFTSPQYRRSMSSSPGSATKGLLSRRSSQATSSDGEFVDENEKKKEDETLYDWLSKSNSPRQVSDVAKSPLNDPEHIDEEVLSSDQTVTVEECKRTSVDLFGTMGLMISFPTSGTQLENVNEVFGSMLNAVGLNIADNYLFCKEDSLSGNFELKTFTVHIVSAEEYEDMQDEVPTKHQIFFSKAPAALCLEDLRLRGHCVSTNSQSSPALDPTSRNSLKDQVVPKDVKVDLSFGSATQVVNIAIIRLLMQITEAIDVIEEENRFAKKIKFLELVGSQTSRAGASADKSAGRDYRDLPKNWRTMHNVLQLYTSSQSLLDKDQINVGSGSSQSPIQPSARYAQDIRIDMHEESPLERRQSQPKQQNPLTKSSSNIYCLIGTVRLAKIRFLAYIGGMDLESELSNLNISYLEKIDQLHISRDSNMANRKVNLKVTESSLTSSSVHLDGVKLVLTESLQSSNQTIATCKISRSHALFSSKQLSQAKVAKRTYAEIGAVVVDIPQHPGILRTVTARFTKRLEKHFIEIDNYRKSKRAIKLEVPGGLFSNYGSMQDSLVSECMTLSFRGYLNSVTVGAILLPSLRVEYKIGKVSANGNVGSKTTYNIKMPSHGVFFEPKVADPALSTLASPTAVELPPVTARGEYVVNVSTVDAGCTSGQPDYDRLQPTTTSTFLKSIIDIGHFEQNLTTNLLNQLIFLQKGFIKEVNQVIRDVDENDPVPLWRTASNVSFPEEENAIPLLYSIQVNLKGIQITATTPSTTAIRLHTGIVALELSNRSPNKEKRMQIPKRGSYMKLFGRAEVDLMVSLGQCNQDIFMDGDDNFESFAYFKTRVGLSNTLQDKPIFHHSQDKETVIITINKPQIYLMPLAVDKGLLVYLHYKNAYFYWLEHTAEVQETAQNIWNRLPQRSQPEKLHGSLFLQLNVERLGLSIPLNEPNTQNFGNRSSFAATPDYETVGPALVMTVEETTITCCSKGSFVSKGLFRNFCLRFAKSFDSTHEEWTFSPDDVMNTCSVPEGSYDLCSRTVDQMQSGHTNKWLMSIVWRMCGVEMHFDSNIGKLLSSLGNALTAFTGDVDVADLSSVADAEDDTCDAFVEADADDYDEGDGYTQTPKLDRPAGTRLTLSSQGQLLSLERQLWEQTKIVNELKQSDAPIDLISQEIKLLQDIESAVSNEYFKDIRKRLRRHARKPSGHITDKLQTPRMLRKFAEARSQLASPAKPLFRRHSSVERYLETKELDELTEDEIKSRYDRKSDRLSLNVDRQGGQYHDYVDFCSNPELSNSNYELNTKKLGVGETGGQKRDPQQQTTPRVTFSDSTADVKTSSSASSQRHASTSTPSKVDFELNIVVDIDSGKCVLHSEVAEKDDDADSSLHMRMQRSKLEPRLSSDQTVPTLHQHQLIKERYSLSDLGQQRGYTKTRRPPMFSQNQNTSTVEDTVLLIPAVNVRVLYQSKTTTERYTKSHSGSMNESLPSDNADSASTSSSSWKAGSKSAGLHAWLSIQQLPREMIVLPSLLDFLEKALEPMAVIGDNVDENCDSNGDNGDNNEDLDVGSKLGGNGTESVLSSSSSDHSSFPVDTIVFINIQPSDIRFSCAPISKVECLLRIPSLDFVISSTSNPSSKHGMPKSPTNQLTKKLKSQQQQQNTSSQKSKASSTAQELTELNSGGFCITACLSRFSFCIFHPYGKQYGNTSERSFAESGLFPGRRKVRGISAQPISGRKDSLSLNVEFIKFNLFRKRVQAGASTSVRGRRLSSTDIDSKTEVKVSMTCDVGSAAFNYDMRRLNEILDVPKAWYKRELYRRMFLGKSAVFAEEKTADFHPRTTSMSDSSMSPTTSNDGSNRSIISPLNRSQMTPEVAQKKAKAPRKIPGHRRTISGASILGNIMGSPTGLFLPRASASVGSRPDFLPRFSDSISHSPRLKHEDVFGNSLNVPNLCKEPMDEEDGTSSSSKSKQTSEWKTHVLVAINLSRLDVATNMGNVMGQSVWSTNDLLAQSYTQVSNTGIKSTDIFIIVRQGSFDAHGGIIGGYIDVHDIIAKGKFDENLGCNPSHIARVMMKGAELRVDYMGSCILMGTLSAFRSELNDNWILPDQEIDEDIVLTINVSPNNETDKQKIKVHGEMGWNELQIVMSRSTTPDLIKMLGKLQDFFNQQQRSGMHAFSGSHFFTSTGGYSSRRGSDGARHRRSLMRDERMNSIEENLKNDGLKYQHWVEILNVIPGLELNNVRNAFKNAVIGGSLTLKSNFISLACFHGSNFRAQTWGLFSINEPVIRFATETECVGKSCQVERAFSKHELSICLGHVGITEPSRLLTPSCEYMATVRKVSRGRRNPPSLGAPVADWLMYVRATNEEYATTDSADAGKSSMKPATKRVSFAPKVRYENDSEIIFGLPCLSLCLTTEHDQPMTTRLAKLLVKNRTAAAVSPWLSTVPSPHVVEASMTSFFQDSLSVTMDVSLLFFLHDLILTYMKEKDAVAVVAASQSGRPYRTSKSSDKQEKQPVDLPDTKGGNQVETPNKKEKYRQFRCKKWKLEPAIRLLGWAGTRMEPVSIDWVLEKLGFMHAALTIPKWLQRGAMDPMDIALSLLLKHLLVEMQIDDVLDRLKTRDR
eukprot:gene7184-7990_t